MERSGSVTSSGRDCADAKAAFSVYSDFTAKAALTHGKGSKSKQKGYAEEKENGEPLSYYCQHKDANIQTRQSQQQGMLEPHVCRWRPA